jgi:hypothetical protein
MLLGRIDDASVEMRFAKPPSAPSNLGENVVEGSDESGATAPVPVPWGVATSSEFIMSELWRRDS